MSKIFDGIEEHLQTWIQDQHLFFVATAPLSASGYVNCSPKGGDSFRIINSREVIYQDLTGSGAETIAHLRENGRIVIMFCALAGKPKILRLHGIGKPVLPSDEAYKKYLAMFPAQLGTRAFIHVTVNRVADSCGYSVPEYQFENDRPGLERWAEQKGEAGLKEFRSKRNEFSIDGLPALDCDLDCDTD